MKILKLIGVILLSMSPMFGDIDPKKSAAPLKTKKTASTQSPKQFLNMLKAKQYSGDRVDFEFVNDDILHIVRQFSKKFDQSISVHPDIARIRITSIIYNIPLDKAFVVFLEQNDLEAVITNDILLIKKKSGPIPPYLWLIPFFSIAIILLVWKLKKKEPAAKQTSNGGSVDPIYAKEIVNRVDRSFDEDKIYRDKDLSLKGLSEQLSIQPYLLSKIINESMGLGFSQLVNRYRIEAAKAMLLGKGDNGSEPAILDIAYAVGFNNKASFNKIFKQTTGKTPSEFKKGDGSP